MRVIAGTARSLSLKTLPGNDTRPTTDKIKETLFNIINFDLPGACFLDLFAGSGAIGIEALSRGAKSAVFADISPKAAAVIHENLKHTHFEEKSEVYVSDSLSVLKRLEGRGKSFDIVFMDPPYDSGLEEGILVYLSKSSLINENTMIIIEQSLKSDLEIIAAAGYEIKRIKQYRTNKHVFLRRNL